MSWRRNVITSPELNPFCIFIRFFFGGGMKFSRKPYSWFIGVSYLFKALVLPNKSPLNFSFYIITLPLYIMNSLSATVPLRTAARPQYLHLALRTCPGVICHAYNPARRANKSAIPTSKRLISSTPQNRIEEYFPPPKNPNVKEIQSAWAHPVYVYHPPWIVARANPIPATPKLKCEISTLHTEKQPIGLTGLLWELSVSSDGAWISRQAIDIPTPARSFRLASKWQKRNG